MALTRAEVEALVLASVSERDFRQQVIDFARLHRWQCWFVWNSRHSPAGWPDVAFAHPTGRFLMAELKTERGRPSPAQSETIAMLRECGLDVRIWRPSSWSEIEATLTT